MPISEARIGQPSVVHAFAGTTLREERLETRVLISAMAGDRTIRPETVTASGVVPMSATLIESDNLAAASFPKGEDTHWITESRLLWNQRHRKTEECELVYEVSWVSELRAWRSFLRSQRWLEATR